MQVPYKERLSGKYLYCSDMVHVVENEISNFQIELRPFVVLEQTTKNENICLHMEAENL